jgi:hypothetical protein
MHGLSMCLFDRSPGSLTQTDPKGLIADDDFSQRHLCSKYRSLWKLGAMHSSWAIGDYQLE